MATSEQALLMLEFAERRILTRQLQRASAGKVLGLGRNHMTERVEAELEEYFAGTLQKFSVPLAPSGTAFAEKVWRHLLSIPYGKTETYGEISRHLGQLNGARAVARANAENPISIIVPCHRVTGANGALKGYGGGLWRKRALLSFEAQSRAL